MPVALLVDIAGDFGVSEAQAGMLVSVYAWMVMLLSLPLTMAASRFDFKRLLLVVVALFGVGQVASACATGYGMLMAARIVVACAHAVFWAIVSPLAVRVVAPEHRSLALGMVVTGSSVAMIAGLPLGRVIGLAVGWRMTFACVAAVAGILLAYLAAVFPKVAAEKPFAAKDLPALLGSRALLGIYALTALVATAYYTGYSYIEPFLQQVVGMGEGWITVALMAFGAAGIVGSVLFSRLYDAWRFTFVRAAVAGVAVSLILLRFTQVGAAAAFAVCALLGMFATAFNVSLQAEVIEKTPKEAQAVAMSVFSGIFNLGIGCGTLLGGAVCTFDSVADVGLVGGVLALAALACCLAGPLRRRAARA